MESNKENIDLIKSSNNFNKENSGGGINGQMQLSSQEVAYLLAACESQFQPLNSILSKNPFFVNMKNPLCGGYTALHFASKYGNTDIIRSLVGNYKADVDITSYSGKTPLHVAVEFKQEEVARLLLSQYNANKNLRDYCGRLAADIIPSNESEALSKLVGPSTITSLMKTPKAPTPALTSLRKGFQGFTSGVSLDVAARGFSLFRKGSDAMPHSGHQQQLVVPTLYQRESACSSPQLHTGDIDKLSIKKSLSLLSNRTSVKRPPTCKGNKFEENPKE